MRGFRAAALALFGVMVLAPGAHGQSRSCDLPPGATNFQRLQTAQGAYYDIQGPVTITCTGGLTLQGNRVLMIDWTKEIQVTGNAVFMDPEKRVSGASLNYFAREGELRANGNVLVTDRASGSTIRGDVLHLTGGTQGGSGSRTVVYGGSPHATLLRARAAARDTAAAPIDVDAVSFDIIGENDFRATGNVRFRRADMQGSSGALRFEQDRGRLNLTQGGRMANPDFRLEGDSIEAIFPNEILQEVASTGRATLTGKELQVFGGYLRMFFDKDELQRLVARAAKTGGTTPDARAMATAQNFRLMADSIDAIAPAQQLEQVIAVGTAYGEQIDTTRSGLPEFASRDWLRGDTIHGYFAADSTPRPRADTTRPTRVLEKLVAAGVADLAQGMHRIREKADSAAPAGPRQPSLNFLVARRISVEFADGEVQQVLAEGELKGIHLQPRPAGPPPEGGARPPDSNGNGMVQRGRNGPVQPRESGTASPSRSGGQR